MHPAYSVILFTTASGAGYGLLVCLALLAAAGAIPPSPLLGIAGLGTAFALISVGLLSSTAHLGHPERAWRAFSQWRTSWLSREGVAAVATYVPFALLTLGWVMLGATDGVWAVAGIVAAVMALVTVWCTGMIYQSLPTIRAWSHPLVAPIYSVLALATGAVLAVFILRLFAASPEELSWAAVALLALALVLKLTYWQLIDHAKLTRSAGSATGLGRFGVVRPLEAPHTQPNFIMREMGYEVGRKHAGRLRALAIIVGFLVPLAAIIASMVAAPNAALLLSAVSVLAVGFGVVVERWLFFAQAQHVAMLYYGKDTA